MAQPDLDFDMRMGVKGMEEIAALMRQVDALRREVDQLKKAMGSASGDFRRAATGLNQTGKQARLAQIGTQQLGMQFNDLATSISAGMNPLMAFQQQIGQIGFAMTQMGGKASKVGAFLAGPWGAAMLLATMALSGVIEKLIGFGDEVDKLTLQDLPALTREIQMLQIQTADTADILDMASEYIKAQEVDYRELAAAIQDVIRGKLALAQADAAEAEQDLNRSAATGGAAFGMADGIWRELAGGSDFDEAMENWRTATATVNALEYALEALENPTDPNGSRGRTRNTRDAVEELRNSLGLVMDPVEEFTQRISALTGALAGGHITMAEYSTALRDHIGIPTDAIAMREAQVSALNMALEQGIINFTEYSRALDEIAQNAMPEKPELDFGVDEVEIDMQSLQGLLDDVAQRDFRRFNDAIRGYTDEMKKSFEAVGQSVSDAFKGMLTGASSWKDAMRGIIQSVIDQLWQLYVVQQITGVITSALGGLGLPFKASGGSVDGNKPYIVGERGPELFIPGASGTVIPNYKLSGAMGGGGGATINVSVDARGASDPAMVDQRVRQGIIEAAPIIIQAAQQKTTQGLTRPRLGGSVR